MVAWAKSTQSPPTCIAIAHQRAGEDDALAVGDGLARRGDRRSNSVGAGAASAGAASTAASTTTAATTTTSLTVRECLPRAFICPSWLA